MGFLREVGRARAAARNPRAAAVVLRAHHGAAAHRQDGAGSDLVAWTLVGINGKGGAPYGTCVLSGAIGDDGRFLVVHHKATRPGLVAAADVVTDCDFQNGADTVLLVDPNGQVRDALAYGVFAAGDIAAGEGPPHPGPQANSGQALARAAAGVDTNDNLSDWVVVAPSF